MNPYSRFASVLLGALAIAGCTSAPAPRADTAAAPAPSTRVGPAAPSRPSSASPALPAAPGPGPQAPQPNEAPAAPVTPPAERPKLSPEAEAVIARLTQGLGNTTMHELADITGFPSALRSLQTGAPSPRVENLGNVVLPPIKGLTADGNSTELVERDWTGLILVPVNTALAKAYTSEVQLLRVEAHPLHDGRLRIWARVRNLSARTLPAEVACSFRMRGETTPNSPYFYELQVPSGAFRDVFFVSPDGELSAYTVLVRSEEMWKQR